MPLTFQALPLHEASCRGIKQCAAVMQTEQIQYTEALKIFLVYFMSKLRSEQFLLKN